MNVNENDLLIVQYVFERILANMKQDKSVEPLKSFISQVKLNEDEFEVFQKVMAKSKPKQKSLWA